MTRRIIVSLLGIALLLLASATTAKAGECMADTMTNYILLNNATPPGCTVEDKIFRKYFYSSEVLVNGVPIKDPLTGMPAVLPPPTAVQVAPIRAPMPPPFSFNPGPEFSSTEWTLDGAFNPNTTIKTTIDYIVEVPAGKPLIGDASLILRGNAINGGSIMDQETVFSTLTVPMSNIMTANCDGVAVLCNNANLNKDVKLSMPVNLVEVDNVLTISCNANANCMAVVSGLENRFSEVPEPPTFALFGAGLVGLGVLRRCRRRVGAAPSGRARRFLWLASFVILCLAGAACAQAGPIVVPKDLAAGDKYYLAFVTSGETTATSGDIATYNMFVNNQAKMVAALKGINWVAMVSTKMVSASTNLGLQDGPPIYLLDGMTRVVNTAAALFAGKGLLHAIDLTQSATATMARQVWTGTTPMGASSGFPFGGSPVTVGDPNSTTDGWVENGAVGVGGNTMLPIYAISQLLTVPKVPEPASSLMWLGIGGVMVIIARGKRIKRL